MAPISWLLPVPLLIFAGLVALVHVTAVVRGPTSAPHLVVETFVVSLAVIGAVWAGWIPLWLLEHRWGAQTSGRSYLGMTLRVPPVPSPKPASIPHWKAAPCRMRFAGRSPPADMVWNCHDLGSCSWNVDHAGWVVTLHSPDEQDFYGKTLEEALAWCLVWLMVKGTGHPQGLDWGHEIGVGPFRV